MPSPSVEHMIVGGFNPHSTKKYPSRRQATAFSVLGGGISLAGPVGLVLGTTLQIPDLTHDLYDLYKTPSSSNALSLILDYPAFLSRYTNNPVIGKFDDWLPYGGMVDDASTAVTGNSVGDWLEEINRINKFKRSLEDGGKYSQEPQYYPYYP